MEHATQAMDDVASAVCLEVSCHVSGPGSLAAEAGLCRKPGWCQRRHRHISPQRKVCFCGCEASNKGVMAPRKARCCNPENMRLHFDRPLIGVFMTSEAVAKCGNQGSKYPRCARTKCRAQQGCAIGYTTYPRSGGSGDGLAISPLGAAVLLLCYPQDRLLRCQSHGGACSCKSQLLGLNDNFDLHSWRDQRLNY